MYKPRNSRLRESCVQETPPPTLKPSVHASRTGPITPGRTRSLARQDSGRTGFSASAIGILFLVLISLRAEPVHSEAMADSLQISSRFSSSEVTPNDEVTLTLSLEDAGDLYYFSFMVDIDFDVLEFIEVNNVGITENGAAIDGIFGGQYIALAVSRTDATPISQTGDFVEITFRVKSLADGESIDISFLSPELSDSDGDDLLFVLGAPPPLTLTPGVGVSELTLDPTHEITEGESFTAHGRIYASGVTADTTKWDDLEVQIGLQEGSTTPDSWPEETWTTATLHTLEETTEPEGIENEPDAERFAYARAGVARRLEPGSYHLAIRTRLTGETDWHYGGMETFPEGGTSTLPMLEVTPQPVYRYALGEWSFTRDKWTPERATVDNDTARFHGANRKPLPETPERSESGGRDWLQTDSWDPDPVGEIDGEPQKAIQTILSTEGFTNLTLSGTHTGTSAGPAHFIIELSLDGESWEALPDSEIDLATESTVALDNLPLPTTYEDQSTLWIRWRQTSSERIDGDDAPVSSSSYFRLAEIGLYGENPDPQRVDIHPGDANGDDVVDASDVLTLAHYWRVHGPAPAYDYIDFERRTVEAWIPQPATDADTNGDGVVDHRDLKAIGLHFGQTVPTDDSDDDLQQVLLAAGGEGSETNEPVARLTLPAMERGEERLVYLAIHEPVDFKGVAVSLQLKSVNDYLSSRHNNHSNNPSTKQYDIRLSSRSTMSQTDLQASEDPNWSLQLDRLPDGAERWREEGRLLDFHAEDSADPTRQAVAWSLQGRHESIRDPQLAVLRITASETWERPRELLLEQLTLGGKGGSMLEPTEVEMSLSDTDPPGMGFPEEEEVTLYPNYPNPVTTDTNIRFYLPEAGNVRLDLFDITGRRISTPLYGERTAGLHTLTLDASRWASGVYFYRLSSAGEVRVRKLVLVK